MRSARARRAVGVTLLVFTTCAGAFLTVVLASRQQQPVYAMPVLVVVVAALCVALTAVGGVLALTVEQLKPWLAPAVVLALMLGFLELGVFVAIPLVVVLILAKNGSAVRAVPRWQRLGAPVLLTLGIVPLSFLALDRPIVECLTSGVTSATPIWALFGRGSMSGTSSESGGGSSDSSSAPQQSTGSIITGGVTYKYTCDGSRLVNFTSG